MLRGMQGKVNRSVSHSAPRCYTVPIPSACFRTAVHSFDKILRSQNG